MNALQLDKEIAPPLGAKERRLLAWLLLGTLFVAAIFLFARLGHYALWDDEAIDAIMAKGILATGDTSAVVDSNILGYRNGLLLNGLRVEGEPPFTAYAAAISMYFGGLTAGAARFPIVLLAFAGIALLLYWIWREQLSPPLAAIFCISLLSNVSLFLFARQCHYYGTAIFCFITIAYIYFNGMHRRGMLLLMGLSSAILLASNYSFLVVLYVCLFVDYVIWQRRKSPLSLLDLVVLFTPPFLMGLAIIAWWNPFHTQMAERLAQDSLWDRVTLFWWHLRDLNHCEMWVGILMLAAPIAAWFSRDQWLWRALFATLLYLIVSTALSTQSVSETSASDIRYYSALIPLFLFIQMRTLKPLAQLRPKLTIAGAVLIFGTNLFHGGGWLFPDARSTPAEYVAELIHPPEEPFSPTARWIRENTPPGSSIWVLPDYMTYPLMFHAPDATYAWQFTPDHPRLRHANLAPIHFRGKLPPDYVITFGPTVREFLPVTQQWAQQGANYQHVATLDYFWKDLYRPELFWRTFRPIPDFDRQQNAIYIFKRQ